MKNKVFKKILLCCFVLSVTLLSASCDKDESILPNADNLLASVQKSENSPQYDFTASAKQPEEYSTYINKCTELGLKMLKSENYETQNTVVAPLSVTLSLSALENGTANATLKEIKNFVGKANFQTDTINQCSTYISQRIRFFNKDGNGVFDTSTVWTSNTLTAKRSFLQKYDNFYNISFYKMNFSDSNTNTLISQYIGSQSDNLLPVGNISTQNTYRLYTDCSVAVSDFWLNGVSDSQTGTFTTHNKQNMTVQYLESTERTIQTDNATAFIKDFKNIPCKLLCIMPNEDITLSQYLETLSYDKLLNIPNQIKPTEFVNVLFPKFSAEKSVSLKKTLTDIGIKTVFSENADFSKGFSENICLDDMTQSLKISVSENGIIKTQPPENTESKNTADNKNTVTFNRPFLYAVIDNECYVPVLLGTVITPDNTAD